VDLKQPVLQDEFDGVVKQICGDLVALEHCEASIQIVLDP
jgi:hypothetical protein